MFFYYFSILLSNWKVSYLFLVFDLLTQPNKTSLCCTTTKSAVHFQSPNKWLAWFIWVISAMWQGSTISPPCKEPVFTSTDQTRWVHYSRDKDGHFNLPLAQQYDCVMTQEDFLVEVYWRGWWYSDALPCFLALLWEQGAGGPLPQVERLDPARGEPQGPEKALRVVKWPLIHNLPPVFTAPPYPRASHWVQEHKPPGAIWWTAQHSLLDCTDLSAVSLFIPWQQNKSLKSARPLIQECVLYY